MNKKHPSAWDPAIMLLNILVSVIGSIIGLELIARLGISTSGKAVALPHQGSLDAGRRSAGYILQILHSGSVL